MVADLAHFQTGIGNEPLSPLGGDLNSTDLSNLDEAQRYELSRTFSKIQNVNVIRKNWCGEGESTFDQLALRAETSRIQIRA